MKIYYDTEFLEDGRTIDLISIGMVTADGREYYAVNSKMPVWKIRRHPWLMENVVPALPMRADGGRNHAPVRDDLDLVDFRHPSMKKPGLIAADVKDFILSTPDVELWAWYGSYDHVALAQLFGRMIDLPDGVPMWTNDLRQEVHRLGNPQMPVQQAGQHNALADARYNRVMGGYLAGVAAD